MRMYYKNITQIASKEQKHGCNLTLNRIIVKLSFITKILQYRPIILITP